AFVNNKRIWIAPLDGSKPAEQAFFARGSSESPRWSPDSRTVAFVSNRDDHSFIGLYSVEDLNRVDDLKNNAKPPIRYVSPTSSRDDDPVWSPDGRTLAFIRMPGRGGAPKSALQLQPQPWSIWLAPLDAITDARPLWTSGNGLVDSVPRTADDRNLRWAAGNRIVFQSYRDGWPHLYSLQTSSDGPGQPRPTLLTAGSFMVEHVALSPDGRRLVYSANAGADGLDVARRHIFSVAVDGSSQPVALTRGSGLEWSPVVTGSGQSVAFLRSDVRRPSLPAVMPIAGGEARAIADDR